MLGCSPACNDAQRLVDSTLMSDESDLRPSMTLRKTLRYLGADLHARLRLLEKEPTFSAKLLNLMTPSMLAITCYRLSHWLFCRKWEFLSKIFYVANCVLFGCDITPATSIGPGFNLMHPVGTMVNAKIGKNATLYGMNAVGAGVGGQRMDIGWFGGPLIGDDVVLGHSAKVLTHGRIGNNVFVGAMSLVTKPLPDDVYVFGIPAKIKKHLKPRVPQDA